MVSAVIFSGSGYTLCGCRFLLEIELVADVRDEGGRSSVEALLMLESSVSSACLPSADSVEGDCDDCSSATLVKCCTRMLRAMCVSEKGRLMAGRKGLEYSRTVSRTAWVISFREV